MLKLNFQYFGHLMWRTDSVEKTLMLRKIEGRGRRGQQRMRWLDGITDSMDMSLKSSRSWWWTGKTCVVQLIRLQWVRHDWTEGLMLKLKFQYSWPPNAKCWLIGKDFDAGKDGGRKKGVAEDEMVGWHHQLNGHESEQTPGGSEGQGSLVCRSPRGHKESDMN